MHAGVTKGLRLSIKKVSGHAERVNYAEYNRYFWAPVTIVVVFVAGDFTTFSGYRRNGA